MDQSVKEQWLDRLQKQINRADGKALSLLVPTSVSESDEYRQMSKPIGTLSWVIPD